MTVNNKKLTALSVSVACALSAGSVSAADSNVAVIDQIDTYFSGAVIDQWGSYNSGSISQIQQSYAGAEIYQHGDYNTAAISQGPNSGIYQQVGASARIDQDGDSNTALISNVNTQATIDQTSGGYGPVSFNYAEIVRTSQIDTPVTIVQQGSANTGRILQDHVGNFSNANIYQYGGDGNTADIRQSATNGDNFGLTFDAEIFQAGNDNIATIVQSSNFGYYSSANIGQYGNGNVASIQQTGADNFATIYQH